MNETCASCKYFRRHYVKFGRGYVPLDQGNCVHPRLKDRTADTPACTRYRCGEKSRQES